MNPDVDRFLANVKRFQPELTELRSILLECGLTEELKWKQPCYTFNNHNIIIISQFKSHCVISFLKGVLLNDSEKILELPGENSQSVRFVRFTSVDRIIELRAVLKSYIFEAIEIEKAGLKVELKENLNPICDELLEVFSKNEDLKVSFEALTPGRQRGYNLFFNAAKQPKTRINRIEKYTERILNGKGINDCVCGHSKKMPGCDGSHKYL